MAVSKAQKMSAKKWDAANLDRVSIAMAKGKKDEVKAAAVAVGESMNQYIIAAIDQRMGVKAPETPQNARQGPGDILTSALKTAQDAAEKAGETVPAFVERAVETQAKRDKVALAIRPKEKAPDESGT